jgi:uroporphyrin-III C-methyltransferase
MNSMAWTGPELGAGRQTLAFYMGASKLAAIQTQLTAHGRPAATPIAIVERGSQIEQRSRPGCSVNSPTSPLAVK